MLNIHSKFFSDKWVTISVGLFLIVSSIYIPARVSHNYFDNLTFPHFVFLSFGAVICLLPLLIKRGFKNVNSILSLSLIILIICLIISTALSENPINALTGDTQRFTGAISLLSLIIILIFHSNIRISSVSKWMFAISQVVFLITFLGILQLWNVIAIPGAGGAASTLGNIDFLSAWIGTTLPFFLFLLNLRKKYRSALIVGELISSVYLLLSLNVKQGEIDLALVLIFAFLYSFRKKILLFQISRKTLYWVLGILGFLWLELVLLVPFQRTKIPFINTDANVQIRTQYWITGFRIFFHHIFFGVGPDNYGNYYQQYRTVTSVLREENTVSNDSHSALFQTLSTLGIFGCIAFLLLFALVIWSIEVNLNRYPDHRKFFYFISVFLVIYSTNAMISPITIPHKFIFWAVLGIVLGLAHNNHSGSESQVDPEKSLEHRIESAFKNFLWKLNGINFQIWLKPILGVSAIVSLAVTISLGFSQVKFISAINDLQVNSKSENIKNYNISSVLPCSYYYLTEQVIANQVSIQKVIEFAKKEIERNPRCIDAHLMLAKYYFANNDKAHLGWEVKALMDMAPANREALVLVGQIATDLNDRRLLSELHNQEIKLGYIK